MIKKKTDSTHIDVNDDNLMVELGMRPPLLTPRDPSVWTKTKQEKVKLRALRKSVKKTFKH